MMDLRWDDYGWFLFRAPPTTGGDWFRTACARCGVLRNPTMLPTNHPRVLDKKVLTLGMVRHPVHWLWLCCNQRLLGTDNDDLLRFPKEDSFQEFVKSYLKECPGEVGRVFAKYAADMVMKVEDQPWALIELLASGGISRTTRTNCMSVPRPPTPAYRLDRNLRASVMDAERELVERCEYW